MCQSLLFLFSPQSRLLQKSLKNGRKWRKIQQRINCRYSDRTDVIWKNDRRIRINEMKWNELHFESILFRIVLVWEQHMLSWKNLLQIFARYINISDFDQFYSQNLVQTCYSRFMQVDFLVEKCPETVLYHFLFSESNCNLRAEYLTLESSIFELSASFLA